MASSSSFPLAVDISLGLCRQQSSIFRMWRLSCLLIFQLHVRKPKSLETSTQRGNRWCELAMSKAEGWLQKYGVPSALYINVDLLEHEMTLLLYIFLPPSSFFSFSSSSFFFFFTSFPDSFNCMCPFHCPVGCMFWMRRCLLLSCDRIQGRVHQEH